MKYPVVNLGGMLEEYKNEINALKAKLNPGGYSQPGGFYTPPPTPVSPVSNNGYTSGYAPPISVPTGAPPPPPEALPPYPPGIVSTGVPTTGMIPYVENPNNPYPPVPPAAECPPGTTWTPSGCLPNVPSQDRNPSRYSPPTPSIVNQPPPPPPPPSTVRADSGGADTIYRGGGGLPGGLFSGGEASTPASGMTLTGRVPYSGAPALLRPIKLRGY